uniref:Uncharacterized protein n=1 Tax=Arundo donax TaxID=35708 RepID=A0A0A9DZ98_ARUDO
MNRTTIFSLDVLQQASVAFGSFSAPFRMINVHILDRIRAYFILSQPFATSSSPELAIKSSLDKTD